MAIFSLNTETIILHLIVLEVKVKVDFSSQITILIKYLDYTDVFLLELVAKFLEHTNSNYIIKLKKDKLPFYSSIYSPEQIELKILKAYL